MKTKEQLIHLLGNEKSRNKILNDKIEMLNTQIKELCTEMAVLRKHINISKVDVADLTSQKIYICREVIESFYSVDISKRNRKRENVIARQMWYHWCLENTKLSLTKLSSALIGQDHSTLIHAKKTINDLLTYDKVLIEEYKEIRILIKQYLNKSISHQITDNRDLEANFQSC